MAVVVWTHEHRLLTPSTETTAGVARLRAVGRRQPGSNGSSSIDRGDSRASRIIQRIGEKTAEIRSVWDPTEAHESWEEIDIESLVETYQRQHPTAEITCSVVDAGAVLVRSAASFTSALNEAVGNAIKHTDQSCPEVMISVHRDPDADQMRVTVADTGPGIPPFERRVIESGEETPLGHSLGIGLWFMKWLMTTLGGELIITDNLPRGTMVTFKLPVRDPNDR